MNRLSLRISFQFCKLAFHAFDSELLIYILTVHYHRKNPDRTPLSPRETVGWGIEG